MMTPQSTHTVFDCLARTFKLWLIVSLVLVSNYKVIARPAAGRSSNHRHRHRHGHRLNYQLVTADPIQCFPTPVNVTLPKDDTPLPRQPLSDHFYRVSMDAKQLKITITSTMTRYLEKRFVAGETEESLAAITLKALPTIPDVTIDMWNENNVKPEEAMIRSHDWLVEMTGHINVTMAHEMERYERDGFENDLTKLNQDVLHLVCRLRAIVIEHDVDIPLKIASVRPIPDVTLATKIYIDYLTLRALRDILYHTEVEFLVLHRTMKQRELKVTGTQQVPKETTASSVRL